MDRDAGGAAPIDWHDEDFGLTAAIPAPAPPPRHALAPLPGIERRLAQLAADAWAVSGGGYVAGFDVNTVLIADPAGMSLVEEVGDSIATGFGIVPGMILARRPGLAAELAAACDLIALSAQPVPFEASVAGAGGALIMARGIALPLTAGADAGKVQAILSWREVLNRAASRQLREELGEALRMVRRTLPLAPRRDPFATPIAGGIGPFHA
ncbi:hypothetical protein IP88_08275 [alpha proteobacterium AAP81b]|nr:hypothetical protein IP88_08275 [alpha proteobacterium AAP81b]